MKIDFKSKENFVIRSEEKSYRDIQKYTLYLYYKNIDYKYINITLDSIFLNINYSIFNNYKYFVVIGDRDKKSKELEYSFELEKNLKMLDHYNFTYHGKEFQEALKKVSKIQKEYEKIREWEKTLTVDNYKELIREANKEKLENNLKLLNMEV